MKRLIAIVFLLATQVTSVLSQRGSARVFFNNAYKNAKRTLTGIRSSKGGVEEDRSMMVTEIVNVVPTTVAVSLIDGESSTSETRALATTNTTTYTKADVRVKPQKTNAPTARSAKKKAPRTAAPTLAPTPSPTLAPTPSPTLAPTPSPTLAPTPSPTQAPTVCAAPLASSVSNSVPVPISACTTLSTTVLDDFETSPLVGWTNGLLDSTAIPAFTSFLGRYGRSVSPEKLYTGIPTDASILKLEFDFYEIDSWDNEEFYVAINCVTIPLGAFGVFTDEGTRRGFVDDIFLETSSLGPPLNRGFTYYPDQIHHVTVILPTRFINGVLKLQFGSNLDEDSSNESYGIDNIEISAYLC